MLLFFIQDFVKSLDTKESALKAARAKTDLDGALKTIRLGNEELQATQAQLVDAGKRLEETLRTLPNADFTADFARKAHHIQRCIIYLLSDDQSVDLGAMIRGLLTDVASLASHYGPHNNDTPYRAHVMTYVPAGTPDLPDVVQPLPASMRPRGFLVLRPDLSASMNEPSPDQTLTHPFCMPVPTDDQVSVGETLAVMPGPQLVFARGEMFKGIADIQHVGDLGVDSNVLENFVAWRSTTSPFKGSLVSFPLAVPAGLDERKRIGVVTIYSDAPGLLGGSHERWAIFGLVVRPFMDGIATLLTELAAEE